VADTPLDEQLAGLLDVFEERLVESAVANSPFVTEMARHIIAAGGKRFRPLLVFLSSRFGGEVDEDDLLRAAMVMELTHVASLYHDDVMDAAEAHFAQAGLRTVSIRGDQTTTARQQAIDAFNNDPDVAIAVCSLTAAGVGVNMQAASNVVLAELSWTAAEQTQAIDRVHRIGQDEPVTAWRIIAAHTIDTKIAELIDSKQSLAARALDGEQVDPTSSDSVQLSALIHLLRQALGAD